MQLPHASEALAGALPDLPRWVETRALLLSSRAVLKISQDGGSGVVMDPDFPSGAVVGRVEPVFLRQVVDGLPNDFELIVQMDILAAAQEALPGWTVAQVVVHSLARPFVCGKRSESGVVVSSPPENRWLEGLPEDVRRYATAAEAMAVRVVSGNVVAVCAAGDVTETLWDVGVDTLENHRQRGHAAACFTALAALMAEQGKQPVWSAYADYPPSLELAAKLGFTAVDRIAVLSPAVTETFP